MSITDRYIHASMKRLSVDKLFFRAHHFGADTLPAVGKFRELLALKVIDLRGTADDCRSNKGI